MKTSTKIILGVAGGAVAIGVGVVLVTQLSGPRLQTADGTRPRSFADTAADLAGVASTAAQTFRDLRDSGGTSTASGGGGTQYTPVDTGASGGGSQYA